MPRYARPWMLCPLILLGVVVPRVTCADSLGIYAGAGAGSARDFGAQHVGWQALLGIRPIPPLGIEFDYADFGSHERADGANARASSVALFAVGYVPLAVPYIDPYVKAGVARTAFRLDRTIDPSLPLPPDACYYNPSAAGCPIHLRGEETHLAVGVGVQGRLAALAVRVDYERFTAGGGHPSLVSLDVLWNF